MQLTIGSPDLGINENAADLSWHNPETEAPCTISRIAPVLSAKDKDFLKCLLDDYTQDKMIPEHGGSRPSLELPRPKYCYCSCFGHLFDQETAFHLS